MVCIAAFIILALIGGVVAIISIFKPKIGKSYWKMFKKAWGCLWKKVRKFGWHSLAMVLTILSIELLQLFSLLGSCDVDDLLLNLVGTTIGFGMWKLYQFLKKE